MSSHLCGDDGEESIIYAWARDAPGLALPQGWFSTMATSCCPKVISAHKVNCCVYSLAVILIASFCPSSSTDWNTLGSNSCSVGVGFKVGRDTNIQYAVMQVHFHKEPYYKGISHHYCIMLHHYYRGLSIAKSVVGRRPTGLHSWHISAGRL